MKSKHIISIKLENVWHRFIAQGLLWRAKKDKGFLIIQKLKANGQEKDPNVTTSSINTVKLLYQNLKTRNLKMKIFRKAYPTAKMIQSR